MTGVSSFLMTEANNHISALAAFNLAHDARLFGRREIIIPEGRVHLVADPRTIPHFIEIERNSCAHGWALNPP
jgi:hypothetical protein